MSGSPKRFLIAGYYGFGNIGDEAILSALLSGIRRMAPGAEITVLSGAPDRTQTLHGVSAILWTDVEAIGEAARRAEVFAVGGGGLFADYWSIDQDAFFTAKHGNLVYYSMLPMLARALAKRCAIVGVGVGPVHSEEGKLLSRLAFEEADRATVRDAESKAIAESLGIDGAKVAVTSDLAFAFDGARSVPEPAIDAMLLSLGVPKDRPRIAVALRRWARAGQENDWEGAVAGGLDLFIARSGAHAIFLPFQKELMPDEDDVAVARRVRGHMVQAGHATVLAAPLSPEMTAAMIGRADAVLAMRFHAAVFALTAGIEPVALAYDPKVDALMNRAAVGRSLLPLAALEPERIAGALASAGDRTRLERFAAEMRAKNEENIRALEELADLPPRTADPALSWIAEQLMRRALAHEKLGREHEKLGREHAAARDELLVRDSQLAALERDLASITGSNTYRLAERIRDLSYRTAPKGTRRQRWIQAALRTARETRALGVRGAAKKYLPGPAQAPFISAYHGFRELSEKARRGKDRAALQEILEKHRGARDIWVLAPSIPWDMAPFQRPQQLAMALARLGVLLFYVDPSPKRGEHGFLELQERIYISRVDRDVFGTLEDFTSYVLSRNKAWTEPLRPARILYDFIEHLDVFDALDPEQLKRDHERLLREATVVSATADLLWREVSAVRADAILCPNGVDYAHFAKAKDAALDAPDDLREVWEANKPVIGYCGAVARWFDYDLLWAVASKRPDLFFLLIGPDHDKMLHNQSLFGLPNVRWVGPRHYSVLPKYLKRFDVATIPFKLNPITHATSPLELFEYMAAGKVIVTTPMKESMRFENVLVGEGPESFSAKLSEALSLRGDAAHLALTDRLAKENTWDARAEALLRALKR